MSANRDPDSEVLKQLLTRIAQDDRAAFAELYRRTAPRLLGVCSRMLVDRRESEEVLQEAFVAVWHRASTFDPARAAPMTWLTALARNKAIDRIRQHHDVAVTETSDFETVADDGPTPASLAERGEEYRRLHECLGKLDSQHRRSIQQAFFTGATYAALAARAKVPLGTMKSWIRRGLLQLRVCLEA